jgi:hypothetical protein
MAVLVTAIHVFERGQDVDPRNKSGDDGEGVRKEVLSRIEE